jgi:hypothetical protein
MPRRHGQLKEYRIGPTKGSTAVWISNFPSICEALVRMLLNPNPSLFFKLALEIPDPLSFTFA